MSTRLSPDGPRRLLAALLLGGVSAALAADALDLHFERDRQRVANERRRVDEAHAARVKACEAQFFVTSCIEQAKAERREALDRLTQQQAVIDDALRKQRVAERLERLQEKQQQAAQRRNAPAARPRVVRRGAEAASAASAPEEADVALPARRPEGPSAAEQRRNAQAYRQRQQAAAAHREAVEKRNAERAAAHKPAASLPVPASLPPASAASR